MKKPIYILLILSMTLGMLAIGPIISAQADCVENAAPDPDIWACDTNVPNPDTAGIDATTNNSTDTITVDPGAIVTNLAGDGITIEMTDGTLVNDGTVSNSETSGTAIFAGGDTSITNNGTVEVDGSSSTAIFTDSGNVVNNGNVIADQPSSTGIITINGSVENNSSILASGDGGTGIITDSGNNTVTNNGTVSATGNDGIAIVTGSGNDEVTLASGSTTDGGTYVAGVLGCDNPSLSDVAVCTQDGNDSVTVEENAAVSGIIDGGADTDTLTFTFFTQTELDAYDPAGGSYGGFSWLNFEDLIGLLIKAAQNGSKHVYFRNDDARGVAKANADGINIYAKPGLIAFIPFSALKSIIFGLGGVRFQVPNDENWFVVVFNMGPFEENPKRNWYQVHIYDGNGALVSDEQGFVY